MTKEKSVANRLLDAHVAFMVEQLTDKEQFRLRLEENLDDQLANTEKLKVSEVVTREMIKKTAIKYASDLDLHGAIPELVGDASRAIYNHPMHDTTTLNDLMGDKQFHEFVDQIIAMREVREQVVRRSVGNPLFAALLSDILYTGIRGYITDNPILKNSGMAQSMMKLGKGLLDRASPGIEKSVEDSLKKYIERNIKVTQRHTEKFLLEKLDDETLREKALDLWDEHKETSVARFREYVGEREVEEAYVTGYEYWKRLRKTAYYHMVIETGIDAFFDKYGDATLRELLDEVGIHREMMLDDAMRFAPHVIKTLKKKKMLEKIVRRNLEPFYFSGKVEEILASG